MRILAIGDVTSVGGVNHLIKNLARIRREQNIDLCIVNGENASFISGIAPELAEGLLRSGADVITGGNHTLQAFGINDFLDEREDIIRPLNYGDVAAGKGYSIVDLGCTRVLILNAMGTAFIEPLLDSPYPYIEKTLEDLRGEYDIAILDFHAEATGEKLALAYYFDGKISVVFGTHTHVPTADGRILPNGTGYITDLGMCGESEGVLGIEPESVIFKMKTRLPGRFKVSSGKPVADGVIFTVDIKTKKTTHIERVSF